MYVLYINIIQVYIVLHKLKLIMYDYRKNIIIMYNNYYLLPLSIKIIFHSMYISIYLRCNGTIYTFITTLLNIKTN